MRAEQFLCGTRVLFLGYEYFEYHIRIADAIRKAGAAVDYFPVMKYRPPWNFVYWGLWYSDKRLFLRYNRAYARSILEKTKGLQYDYVFVMLGWQLPKEFYTELRIRNPRAVFLNYHWDSVRETEFGSTLLDLIPLFDRVYSFDKQDCKKYNGLYYLPLFYTEQYAELRRQVCELRADVDLLFIGCLNKYRRYQGVKAWAEMCSRKGIEFAHYMYVSRRFYISNLVEGRLLTGVHARALSQAQIVQRYRRTRAILDLPQQVQSGLTMRVIESLGAGRKLITTNRHIADEPFYDPKNILIVDENEPEVDPAFIRGTEFVWSDVIERYSLMNWLKTIFSEPHMIR